MIIIPGRKKNLDKRYYANIIDYSIVFVLIGIYIFAAGDNGDSRTYRVSGFKALMIPVLWFLYFPVFESITGYTIGKRALHLAIVDLNGDPPSIIQAFLRRLLDMFEIVFLGIPALLTINFSSKNQRVGDMIAGTTVVRIDAVCRFCGTELELFPKEVIRDIFVCPNCKEMN